MQHGLEGLRIRTLPLFRVQYHPEARRPDDSHYFFKEFMGLMEECEVKINGGKTKHPLVVLGRGFKLLFSASSVLELFFRFFYAILPIPFFHLIRSRSVFSSRFHAIPGIYGGGFLTSSLAKSAVRRNGSPEPSLTLVAGPDGPLLHSRPKAGQLFDRNQRAG